MSWPDPDGVDDLRDLQLLVDALSELESPMPSAVGRIAYNRRHKIVGMLVLPPEDVPSAAF